MTVTKIELLTSINELEIKLDNIKAAYQVRNISIKSLKVELSDYLEYLLDIEQDYAITNLSKHITSNTTLDTTKDIRIIEREENSGHNVTDELMPVSDTSYSSVKHELVLLPEIQTSLEVESIKSVSMITNHTKKLDNATLDGSGQDSIFWLRKVYLQITNQVLTENQQAQSEQLLFNNSNTKVSEILQRSDTFKKYLTFRCTKPSEADLEYLDRINWVSSIDDTWGDYIIYPDWTKVDKIKFSTIIRILKYSIANEAKINNDYLLNKYFGRDNILRCPKLIALDILTSNIGINHANSVLASAINLDLTNHLDRIIQVRKNSYPVNLTFIVPWDTKEQIIDSVKIRTIGKVKRVIPQTRGSSKAPRSLDDWCLLSQRVTNTEIQIIASDSPAYRDSVLVFKRYSMETNAITGNLSHPQWLLPTQKQFSIKDNDIVGYIGIRYQSGKIDRLGIIHTKEVKNKSTKDIKIVLWFTLLQKTETKQINRVSYASDSNGGLKEEIKMVNKMVRNGKLWEQKQVPIFVPITQLSSTLESKKIELNSNITMFLSLYGLSHNGAIKPSKLVTINSEIKHISVNWSILTGIKVAPINKAGEIKYDPKYCCPFTVVQ
jgi:hypothetical protein